MAVIPRDIPITRADVQGWIDSYNLGRRNGTIPPQTTMKMWIHRQVAGLNLADDQVNTVGMDNLPDTIHVAEMIARDLDSYATGS